MDFSETCSLFLRAATFAWHIKFPPEPRSRTKRNWELGQTQDLFGLDGFLARSHLRATLCAHRVCPSPTYKSFAVRDDQRLSCSPILLYDVSLGLLSSVKPSENRCELRTVRINRSKQLV